MRQRWEYWLMLVPHAEVASAQTLARLNKLGAEGWELVSAQTQPYAGGGGRLVDMIYVLKRLIEEGA